jgi:hypothetical protein
MPVHEQGAPASGDASTNGDFRKEIKDHGGSKGSSIATVKRTADNVIPESSTFHYDSKPVDKRYKFEVQHEACRGKLARKTVAVVLVEETATGVAAFKTAVENAKVYRAS